MTRAALAVPLVALAAGVAVAPACGPAPRPGERVEVVDETALIVWDPATKTEHFIRRGAFKSTAPDFGFLVPTPAKPDLGEADPAVFGQLAGVTAPKIEYRQVKRARERADGRRLVGNAAPAPDAAPRASVEVLDRKKVGGYDATVIALRRAAGEDAAAGAEVLADWLKEKGYAFGPALRDWLTWYVEHDWVITAFKVDGAARGGVENPPVRMTFKADRPFYPYREPADQRSAGPPAGPRSLRVFFLSPGGRAQGALGADEAGWPGQVKWADKLSADQAKGLAPAARLPAGLPAGDLTLTEWEDHSSPRPGTDEVYFAPAADQTPVHRPPIVHEIVEWIDPVAEPAPASAGGLSVTALAAAGGGFAVFAALYFLWVARRP